MQNIFITSNFSGTENTDYTNLLDYDRNVSIAGNITMASGKTVDGVDISALPTTFAPTNADVTPSWVPSSDPGYFKQGSYSAGYTGDMDSLTGFNIIRSTAGSNRAFAAHHNVITIPNSSASQYGAQMAFETGTVADGGIKFRNSTNGTFGDWYRLYHEGHKPTLTELGAAAALGTDDNYVTDAEKTVIGNTSGTNTGDQDLSGYLTSSSTQSKYLRSDISDSGTGTLTLGDTGASDNPLILGSSSQTSYTLQQWQTSAHGTNEAYIIAYGAGHGSQATNFAMKNIESGGEIFFELASNVEPLRLTSTGATFAGTIGSGAITSTGKITGTELEGTSLDINGNGDISGNANIGGTLTTGDQAIIDTALTVKRGGGAAITLRREDTSIVANDVLGVIDFTGDDPSATHAGAQISGVAAGEWTVGSPNAYPSKLVFKTAKQSSLLTALTIDEDQHAAFAGNVTVVGGLVFQSADGANCSPVDWLSYTCPDSSGTTVNAKIAEGEVIFIDNSKVSFGDSSDLQIYHDGSNSYVSDVGTGSLILTGTDLQLKSAGDEFYMYGAANGQVSLYNNGIKKFETTSLGVAVTGDITASGTITSKIVRLPNGTTADGSSSNNNYFSKIATFAITSGQSYDDIRVVLDIVGEETSASAYAKIGITIRKDASSNTTPSVADIHVLDIMNANDIDSQIDSDSFYLKYNSSTAQSVDLYMKKKLTYGKFNIFEKVKNTEDWVITYYTNSAWVSSLPMTSNTVQSKHTSGTVMTTHAFQTTGQSAGFIPLKGTTPTQGAQYYSKFQPPSGGVLERITLKNTTSTSGVVVKVYGGTTASSQLYSSNTLSLTSNTPYSINPNVLITDTDSIAINVDPGSSNATRQWQVTCWYKF